jgi:hypothetical protein
VTIRVATLVRTLRRGGVDRFLSEAHLYSQEELRLAVEVAAKLGPDAGIGAARPEYHTWLRPRRGARWDLPRRRGTCPQAGVAALWPPILGGTGLYRTKFFDALGLEIPSPDPGGALTWTASEGHEIPAPEGAVTRATAHQQSWWDADAAGEGALPGYQRPV